MTHLNSWQRSQQKVLEKGLRRRGRRYRYTSSTSMKWNKTRGKRSIHTRLAIVEKLVRYGDLEGDTIFGKDGRDRLLTHVDRVAGLLALSLVRGYDSHRTHQQALASNKLPNSRFKLSKTS